MDWFSLTLLLGIGTLFVVTMVMVSANIGRNLRAGQSHREVLEERVAELRMGGMVERLGMPGRRYVHKVPVVEVEQQARRCGECAHTSDCDEILSGDALDAAPAFCANAEALNRVRPLVVEGA